MTSRVVLNKATGEIGYVESPAGSNRTKYGAEYGWNGVAWCVIFLWWVFRKSGAGALFYGGGKIASCSALMDYAKKRGLWVTDGYRPGDLVIFNFPGTRYQTDHIGIVESIDGDKIVTIEGNTSPSEAGSQQNGGCVARKRRSMSLVIGAYRPKYTQEEENMTGKEIYEKLNEYLRNEPAPEWARDELKKAVDAGITDGTRPMQLMPRYQAAIMALRAGKQ